MRRSPLLAAVCVLALAGAGGVVLAQSAQDPEADPVTTDDLNRQSLQDAVGALIRETAPAEKAPPRVQPPAKEIIADPEDEEAAEGEDAETEDEAAEQEEVVVAKAKPERPAGKRQRRPVAVIRAIDKITAEAMTFEVRVGGPPVRFKGLIFTARACELSASDEPIDDAIAYMEIRSQPRGAKASSSSRQVYRGWMYASSPAVSGPEHPIYDAWVVNCRA